MKLLEKIQQENNVIFLFLSHDIDKDIKEIINYIDEQISKSKSVILDLKNVNKISSDAQQLLVDFIIEKNTKKIDFVLRNMSRNLKHNCSILCNEDILFIEPFLKEIDISNCKVLGQGMCGQCIKIDDETILKLYFENMDYNMIVREKVSAKEAFILGVPTAISFDMVKVGNRIGILFELLQAETFLNIIKSDIDNIEHYAQEFARLIKKIHNLKGNKKRMFDKGEQLLKMFENTTYFEKEEKEYALSLFKNLPSSNTCIHGDFHVGNVMNSNGELLFIDMGDFSIGHPYHDIAHLAGLFSVYSDEKFANDFLKLNTIQRQTFYDCFIKEYFKDLSEEEIKKEEEIIELFIAFRLIFYIENFPVTRDFNIILFRNIIKKHS